MKKNGFRKGLVCGIIILFIGVSIVPLTGIGAENHCLINDSIGYFNSIRKSEECGVNVTLNGTMGDNGWYISCVTITFTVNGEVDYIMYKIDDGEWTVYTEPFVVCEDGEHTLYWYYVDNEGNQSAVECIDFKIEKDLIPPETEHDFSGIMGDNDWYVSDVTVTLIATDNAAGVNYTMYKLDDGEWTEYTEPFKVCEDGVHNLWYYSVDKVENKENDTGPFGFNIDQTVPTIELTWDEENSKLIADVYDETSGVAKVEFYVNGEYVGEATESPYEWTVPDHKPGDKAQAIVYDNAGNEAISETPVSDDTLGPEIVIASITGGIGVRAVIENIGDADATDVNWSITFHMLMLVEL